MKTLNILFTGASSGFGATIYQNLKNWGHNVVGVGLGGPDVVQNFCDDPDVAAESVFSAACTALGARPDVLVNNAGITHIEFLENHKISDFQRVMRVNLEWPFALTKLLVTASPKDKVLRIINTSSMGPRIGLRASPAYVASKAGMEAMVKTLAKEFAGVRPITIACIAPGSIQDTQMAEYVVQSLVRTRGMNEEEARIYSKQSPMKRTMTHEEILAVYKFAIFEMPEYMTGTVLYCPAGMGV